jgi:hypothetical protein
MNFFGLILFEAGLGPTLQTNLQSDGKNYKKRDCIEYRIRRAAQHNPISSNVFWYVINAMNPSPAGSCLQFGFPPVFAACVILSTSKLPTVKISTSKLWTEVYRQYLLTYPTLNFPNLIYISYHLTPEGGT